MSKLQIEYWPLDRLADYGRALRKNEGCVDKMIRSIQEFGFRVPVLAERDGTVVDGSLRLAAARRMGLADVPVLVADDLTPSQIRAFRVLVNRSATWAEWDFEQLGLELSDLRALDIDLSLCGFDSAELDSIMAGLEPAPDKDPDAAPPPPETPQTRPGELWLLGEHMLLCGDATIPADAERLAAALGRPADMVFTDPPYNVDYQGKAGKIKNDKMSDAAFEAFLLAAFRSMFALLADGGAIYVARAETGSGTAFRAAFAGAGFKLAAVLIWIKNHFVLGRGDYHHRHEPILYGWKPTGPHRFFGGRAQTTVLDLFGEAAMSPDGAWHISLGDRVFRVTGQDVAVEELCGSLVFHDKPLRSDLHPTMKPVGLVEGFVRNSSERGGLVFDPFGGSGSTLIACERLGRRCATVELDPRFCDVIIRRWQDYTGKTAVSEHGRELGEGGNRP